MIGVVAHDAGGAEQIAHYLLRGRVPAFAALRGPAAAIFDRLRVPVTPAPLASLISMSEWLLCGTSWQSDFEHSAIRDAASAGRRTVAFLDHWTNFADRFMRDGIRAYPDEVWVTDAYACTLAHRDLPGVPVRIVGNPYLDALADAARARGLAAPVALDAARTLLLVTEPTSEHALRRFGDPQAFGYTEHDAARFLMEQGPLVCPRVERFVVRPHPAEAREKYEWIPSCSPWPVALEPDVPLLDHLLRADVVAGANTMAMVAALHLGRPVLSCIPPGGPACALPHDGIVMLRDAITKRHDA